MIETKEVTITSHDDNVQTTENLLIALKVYEDRIKSLRKELQQRLPKSTSTKTPWGKVTLSDASRITINGAGVFALLESKGVDPREFGECSVKIGERTLNELVACEILTNEEATSLVSVTDYEMLRVTPNEDAKEMIPKMTAPMTMLLESDDE